jgi:hypothetical protein
LILTGEACQPCTVPTIWNPRRAGFTILKGCVSSCRLLVPKMFEQWMNSEGKYNAVTRDWRYISSTATAQCCGVLQASSTVHSSDLLQIGWRPSNAHHHLLIFPELILFLFLLHFLPMFGRLNQLARHLSRPLPHYAHRSAAAIASTMTSPSTELGQRMIHTAGCLIIGDEVLGGKVL